jgi:hypothetical protein
VFNYLTLHDVLRLTSTIKQTTNKEITSDLSVYIYLLKILSLCQTVLLSDGRMALNRNVKGMCTEGIMP